jgi:hypothetical protein
MPKQTPKLVNFSSANAEISMTNLLSTLMSYTIPINHRFLGRSLICPLNSHITDTLNVLTEVIKAVLNMVQRRSFSAFISSGALQSALHGMVLIPNHHQTMQLMRPRYSINIPRPIITIWNSWGKIVLLRIVDQDEALISRSEIGPYCIFLLRRNSTYCTRLYRY